MLYFEDNKTSRKALLKLLDGILDFMDMCEPDCRIPISLSARTYSPDGELDYTGDLSRHDRSEMLSPTASKDGTGELVCLSIMEKELERVREMVKSPHCDMLDITWEPKLPGADLFPTVPYHDYFGQSSDSATSVPCLLQLVLVKISADAGINVALPTPYTEPGGAFEAFLTEAERRLPFKLQRSKWRMVHWSKKGTPVMRKVKWPE